MAQGLLPQLRRMPTGLGWILLFSLLGASGSLIGGGILLLFPKTHARFRDAFLCYAIGTLLGAAFLGLLPEALDRAGNQAILATTLGGFISFFAIEKTLLLPHGHAQREPTGHAPAERPSAALILLGDGLHNFVDGCLIAAAFANSFPLGTVTALAVAAHEIPQELGDFVVLLESGMRRWRAYLLNFVSALATVAGALLTYFLRAAIGPVLPFVLAASAASFIYIAAVDLAPLLHHRESRARAGFFQTIGILLGVGTIFLAQTLLG